MRAPIGDCNIVLLNGGRAGRGKDGMGGNGGKGGKGGKGAGANWRLSCCIIKWGGGREGREEREEREGREGREERKGCGHLLEAVILYC